MAKKPARPAPERSPWAAATVAPEDLEVAKREALLQLRIGRASHLAAVAVSAALALDALLLLVLGPHALPALHSGETGWLAARDSYYLILPIGAAVCVSAVGVVSKWEAFQVWPWEPHFSLSVGALALSVAIAAVYGARVAGAGPLGHIAVYPTLVPLSLLGTTLGLVGIASTWRPWGGHQWTSVLTAVLPIAVVLDAFFPAYGGASAVGFAVALLISAILYQTSGSFLHLVSSGTAPHEQAVVLSGQNRIVKLASELQQRDEALRFRAAALVKRETDVETNEATLGRALANLRERQGQLEKLEEADQTRADKLAAQERELAGRNAAVEANTRALLERGKELEVRNAEIAHQVPELAGREQRLARHEGELAKRDAEIRQRVQNLDRREASIAEGEGRVAARRKEIEQKTSDLLRREGELVARERGPALPGPAAARGNPAAADLATREAKLQHLQSVLDEQNAQLGRRAKEAAEQAKVLEGTLRQIAERQAHLASRETALSQREEDLDERLKSADQRRLQFESAARDYQQRLDDVGHQQIGVAQKSVDLDHRLGEVAEREKALAEREGKVRSSLSELDRREGEVLLRERSVDADEAEVSLRRQEIAREGDLPFAGLLAVAAADRAEGPSGVPSSRGSRARRARPPTGPGIVEVGLPSDPGTLSAPSGRKYPDRQPTGTQRLDDLLLGGLPPKSHVVLVGEAFVGKEVALYAFLAEGLKRGEPALLVTAARSSAEISSNLGVVLPQFREYEQIGSVTWIDASGAGTTPGPHTLVPKSSDDRAGLLTSLVQGAKLAEEAAKGGAIRVGFFGLSAVMAHADERASFSFLQNVVGILKPRNALAMYALEAGALSESQVESLLGLLDGAILFRQDRDRTFLSVKGFGDVATREWVEVRATNRALVVGSFALERIR